MKKVYAFFWDCHRSGTLNGMFVADDNDVKSAIGKDVYFGEVLGKHSDVYGDLEEKDFTVLSEDPKIIEFIENFPSGYNPLNYLQEEELEDEEN